MLFAPGPHDPAVIRALVGAVAPTPFDLLVAETLELVWRDRGAWRAAHQPRWGASLAAWTGFTRAARALRCEGSFAGLANLVPYPEINGLFAAELRGRSIDDQWGRSESLDPDNVGDIADEGPVIVDSVEDSMNKETVSDRRKCG